MKTVGRFSQIALTIEKKKVRKKKKEGSVGSLKKTLPLESARAPNEQTRASPLSSADTEEQLKLGEIHLSGP